MASLSKLSSDQVSRLDTSILPIVNRPLKLKNKQFLWNKKHTSKTFNIGRVCFIKYFIVSRGFTQCHNNQTDSKLKLSYKIT